MHAHWQAAHTHSYPIIFLSHHSPRSLLCSRSLDPILSHPPLHSTPFQSTLAHIPAALLFQSSLFCIVGPVDLCGSVVLYLIWTWVIALSYIQPLCYSVWSRPLIIRFSYSRKPTTVQYFFFLVSTQTQASKSHTIAVFTLQKDPSPPLVSSASDDLISICPFALHRF